MRRILQCDTHGNDAVRPPPPLPSYLLLHLDSVVTRGIFLMLVLIATVPNRARLAPTTGLELPGHARLNVP